MLSPGQNWTDRMILIVDLTNPEIRILSDQFVSPVYRIVHQCDQETVAVRLEQICISQSCIGIIICGTALADSWYMQQQLIPLLEGWKGPVLGISTGMQMLLSETGGELQNYTGIGMTSVHVTDIGKKDPLMKGKEEFSGYVLHRYVTTPSPEWVPLATSGPTVQVAGHCTYPWYGVLFYPEVRNEWMIKRFIAFARGF
ncbi:MAG: hypothetical protein GX268_08070 [Methanomicrobiales archaeon]|nr:hypothetical protein [Methanomicrobiales archaeon]